MRWTNRSQYSLLQDIVKEMLCAYHLKNAKYAFKLAILTFSLVTNLIGNWEFKIIGTRRTTQKEFCWIWKSKCFRIFISIPNIIHW